jgi:intracellular multiplication protein IcmP
MSQQKSPNEDVMMAVAIAGLLGGGAYLIWVVFHTQLTDMVRWIRWGELWVDKLLVGDNYSINSGQGNMGVGQWRGWLRYAPVGDISPQHLGIMTDLAVPPLRIVFAVLLGVMGLLTIFLGHGTQYRRRMGLEALMREQAKSFPSIQPFLKFDPRKLPFRAPGQPVPAQLPLFSEALSPEEFLAYHEIAVAGGQLDHGKAYQALSLQLGKRWQGPMKLPLHAQGLYAAFALKHIRKRKESEAILDQLAVSWSADGGFKASSKLQKQIKKILKDPKIGGALQKYADQHAYETTAMLRCLARAREEGGVIASAQFLWLRGQDRALWYPLNNLGRKAYHAEAAGALVHYINEIIAGQKIPTARFDEIIRNFETYLKSGVGRAIPPLDKKAGGVKYWKK